MKNHLVVILIAIFCLSSCQDGKKKTEKQISESTEKTEETPVNENLKTLNGEFIYVDNAAVLKGRNFIYGVKIDPMSKKLAQKTDSLKRNEFDMVPVVIKGIVSKNTEEGWEKIVTIKEIVSVSKPVSDPAIRVETGKSK